MSDSKALGACHGSALGASNGVAVAGAQHTRDGRVLLRVVSGCLHAVHLDELVQLADDAVDYGVGRVLQPSPRGAAPHPSRPHHCDCGDQQRASAKVVDRIDALRCALAEAQSVVAGTLRKKLLGFLMCIKFA